LKIAKNRLIYILIIKKKGETDLQSICQIKKEVEKRFENNLLPEGYQAKKQSTHYAY
jgi:hypothetical protein